MKAFWNFFSSVKLAIVLIIIITLASILGTLIPQHRSPADYARLYGQLAPLLINLEITKLYHSWWYILLLFLFAFNIIVCTLSRIRSKLKRAFQPKLEKDKSRLQALKISAQFEKQGDLSPFRDDLIRKLRSRRYRISSESTDNIAAISARKRVLGLFGSDIVHLGLIIILAGGIVTGFSGIRRNLTLSEGEVLAIPESDFSLRLDKFETDFYPNGAVKDWKSTLTVIRNQQEILNRVIEVNHPLSFQGFVFYQSNYGWDWQNPRMEIWVKKASDPEYQEKITLGLGEAVRLEDGATEITAKHFEPDFIIGENNQVTSRSWEPNNPAVFIEGRQEEEKVFEGWVFARYPDFTRIHSQETADFSFEFKDLTASQYSGLQMAKDPGVNFIWAGCIILTLGLFFAFYWPPREIKAILEKNEDRIQVSAAGIAAKSREALATELNQIMTSLGRKQ